MAAYVESCHSEHECEQSRRFLAELALSAAEGLEMTIP
jgi:hypothetical protein